jgi:hypothetical protein
MVCQSIPAIAPILSAAVQITRRTGCGGGVMRL